jgi:hypothetical protein
MNYRVVTTQTVHGNKKGRTMHNEMKLFVAVSMTIMLGIIYLALT